MKKNPMINVPHKKLEEYCRENKIRSLSFFGSVLRDDFKPDSSDVDILVDFYDDMKLGFEFIRIQEDLSNIIGYAVDLNTPESLSKYFKDDVQKEALEFYVAA